MPLFNPARWLQSMKLQPPCTRLGRRRADAEYLGGEMQDVVAPKTWIMAPPSARHKSCLAVLGDFAAMGSSSALHHLQSRHSGLSEEEAWSRLKTKGPNVLSCKKPPTWWQLLLYVIPNPFNILLAAIAVISVATPQPSWPSFTILIVMIIISCGVRFWQEYKNNAAAIKLAASVTNDVNVRRRTGDILKANDMGEGQLPPVEMAIDRSLLVPGDIVFLNAGDTVPADCLVLEATRLQVSQSSLTGESEAVKKAPLATGEKGSPDPFDLENVIFMGTSIISGSGLALVVRTGDAVFVATIMKELNKRTPINAFQRGIRNVTYMLIIFICIMVPVVLVISGEVTKDWKGAVLFSLSVAVGLVPEMLPAIVNANLARGAYIMSKKKAIVKRLDSIQNLGAMSILCSDKTGTLTKDEIALHDHVDSVGNQDARIFHLAYVNAVNQSGTKNSIDAALIRFDYGFEEKESFPSTQKVTEIPFTFEKRRSSVIVKGLETGMLTLICKGAADELLTICSKVRAASGELRLDPVRKAALSDRILRYSVEGFRVLILATRNFPEYETDVEEVLEELESDLTIEGLLTFQDPAKDDAAASIKRLQELGVDVRILTGDNLEVAVKVAQTLNLVTDIGEVEEGNAQAISGKDLASIEGTKNFDDVVRTCKVFAKLTPSQKGQVVMSLKKSGEGVGMLGDGINDCVALKMADVGISVDSGAAVAKDSADVILTAKELAIVVDSVIIGRLTHANTIKYIKMVASSNFGNVFSIVIASAWLPFEPMTSLQILIQNLLYDISQIAIPWDRVDPEYLTVPRKWNPKDLLRFVLVLGPTSSTIDMMTFCLGWFYYGIQSANDPVAVQRFHTHWFLEGLLTQTLIVHLLRTEKVPFFQRRASRVLVASTVGIMLIGFSLPYIPVFESAMKFVRPSNTFIGFLVAELLWYCIEVQLVKMLYIRVFHAWL